MGKKGGASGLEALQGRGELSFSDQERDSVTQSLCSKLRYWMATSPKMDLLKHVGESQKKGRDSIIGGTPNLGKTISSIMINLFSE